MSKLSDAFASMVRHTGSTWWSKVGHIPSQRVEGERG